MSKVPEEHKTRLADQTLGVSYAVMAQGGLFPVRKMGTYPGRREEQEIWRHSICAFSSKTKKYFKKTPLILNGKVPVHTGCNTCDAWLEAYAKIVNGKFDRIVETEATKVEKEIIIIPRTARVLRDEFEKRLSHLQESCNNEKTKWTRNERTRDDSSLQTLVCRRCDKILETKNTKLGTVGGRLKHWKEEEHRADNALADMLSKDVRPRLKGPPAEVDVREMRNRRIRTPS